MGRHVAKGPDLTTVKGAYGAPGVDRFSAYGCGYGTATANANAADDFKVHPAAVLSSLSLHGYSMSVHMQVSLSGGASWPVLALLSLEIG